MTKNEIKKLIKQLKDYEISILDVPIEVKHNKT